MLISKFDPSQWVQWTLTRRWLQGCSEGGGQQIDQGTLWSWISEFEVFIDLRNKNTIIPIKIHYNNKIKLINSD